jgi:DNA-binding NtrC family response regulator/predicted negative regulator of RcsB-dependent stress response
MLTAKRAELLRANFSLFRLFSAELELASGHLEQAVAHASQVLQKTSEPATLARAHLVLAEVSARQLHFTDSASHFLEARRVCRETKSAELAAGIELAYGSLFSGVRPIEDSESEFNELKRAVARSASPRHIAELRLIACRLEARKGATLEARRHLELSQAILARHTELRLLAQSELDACVLDALDGHVRGALEHAKRAGQISKDGGHFALAAGADIDAAHMMEALGEHDTAVAIIERLLPRLGLHRRLRLAALDCLANILIARRQLPRAAEVFAEIASVSPTSSGSMTPHWDAITEMTSKFAFAKTVGDAKAVDQLLAKAIDVARTNNDRSSLSRLQLHLASVLIERGEIDRAATPLAYAVDTNTRSPEFVARTAAVLSAAQSALGDLHRAVNNGGRARRIAETFGNKTLADAIPTTDSGVPDRRAGLDDAVALVELAGYPHVLAREAYALLDNTGAVDNIAIVARGKAHTRLIDHKGWDEDTALAAAGDQADRLRIACGTHRDEAWQIVADVRPSLADRCTAIAIRKLVDTAVTLDRYRREEKQRAAFWPPDSFETDGGLWISEQMTELLSLGRRIAPTDITILLTGETGTGKEVLARAIHRASNRAAKPFVPFNCTAVARDMLDSQLFGYRRGAFTGADTSFEGVIRAAAGGTLFLDEIAEVGLELQPKLLRFLETHEVHGLGETQPVKTDVRVIAATNADLDTLVAEGRFREDLFYRLNVGRLKLPPLRERREEIPPLLDHYLRTFSEELKKERLTIDDETLEYLLLYSWPGNVRQLVNELRRIVAYAEPNSRITPALLSPEIQASRRTVRVLPGEEPEIRIRLDQPMNDAIEMIEQAMVKRALERAQGNYENASRLLGISRKGLFLKRRRWGMARAS